MITLTPNIKINLLDMKSVICFLLFFYINSCKLKTTNNVNLLDKDSLILNEGKPIKIPLIIHDFIKAKSNKIVSTTKDIPILAIKGLEKINGVQFKLGDSLVTQKINLSDARIDEINYFDKKLNFAIYNKSICLISYIQGGEGVHNVIEFIKYKGRLKYYKYLSIPYITDTASLMRFIEQNDAVKIID